MSPEERRLMAQYLTLPNMPQQKYQDYGFGQIAPADRFEPNNWAANEGEIRNRRLPQDPLTPAYQGVADAVAAVAAPPIMSGTKFFNEPSLPNATRFGVDAAMAAFRPGAAAGVLAGGMGAAALQDAGVSLTSPAVADDDGSDPLSPEQRRRLVDIQARQKKYGSISKADREEQNTYLSTIQAAQTAKAQARAAAEQKAMELEAQGKAEEASIARQESERAVQRAEGARDKELAKDKRFSDTEMGRVWESTGGWGPAILGGALGSMSRVATGGGTLMKDYGLPAVFGGIGGAASNNIPLAYNAFMTEPDNPQKRAYDAYARELPPDHPRKAEWQSYASGLPSANPVRAAAADELYDGQKLLERMGMGAIEGVGGGLAGSDAVRIPGRMVEWGFSMPGRAKAASARSNAAAFGEIAKMHEASGKVPPVQPPIQLQTPAAPQILGPTPAASGSQAPGRAIPGEPAPAAAGESEALRRTSEQAAVPVSDTAQPPLVGGTNQQQQTFAPPGQGVTNNIPNAANGQVAIPPELVEAAVKALSKYNSAPELPPVPPPPPRPPVQSGASLDDIWAAKYSSNARDIVADHFGGGGSLVKGLHAKKGGLSIEELDKRIAASAGGQGAGKEQTGKRLGALREHLANKGVPIEGATAANFLSAIKDLPPTVFGVPLAAAAGASAMSDDDLRRRMGLMLQGM